MVAPVRFRSALHDYHRCQANLLPVNYDQVARTALYFELAQDELLDQEVRKLDELSLYAQTDKNVTRIFIDGHTDAVGLRAANLELSRQRAGGGARYLLDRGLPETLLPVRWLGERFP